ncbi:type II toxin-antitoxin system PemK/MazF family toxin [Mesorhizobium sp.]|uniref:type II toxin-antitoxin system PemK/MazF family toxin n=1 Tax=Mesorhizobium sp. TaxID=1871066 RepID=UPI000FE5CEF2|nr:type II toxin-antitoxin system PemK/MazF family toxin [Mesorhizobium sp.]RWK48542.1 MAG: mRNA-degrading endonuclease [Mesorhizobium sp.]
MTRWPQVSRSATSSSVPYCPEQYDIIRISFDPQMGREQAERRPAFVLSSTKYNSIVRLCILCPITNQAKNYPFEVAVPSGKKTTGVVLSDQVKSFDWSARNAEFIENRPDLAAEVLGKMRAILGL